ncbi:iron-sulfur cluster repair protein YtfE [Rhodopila globiformis]|uniref:Iron-sulfur cluster repair di-iron protein n=1 Tax=Rhodopila globiformis TaxID=1071 RepID=A0A2S6NN37_RHOGL|nr:iron-sulfur cluster repair protein YtfE [Rhodopila globiformis]PPQ38152.1 iron-sulfur cluster repair di-iron protein [Rhodopila globiformis]
MSATAVSEASFADRTLADIAASLPGATRVFRRSKLDFCCGGGMSLADAAAAKGLSLAALDSELAGVAALALPPERPDATEDLIALVENRYHAVHRRELPELVRLARRVEAVHRDHPAAPHGLADRLERMVGELEDHMRKEEQILFPLMRRGGHPMISQPIYVMTAEHDEHGAHLRELERLTGGFQVPEDACPTWRALYAGAQKLAEDLMDHIHIENNVLFPRFG